MVSSVPTIIKILTVFSIILLLNRLRLRLSLSLLIGSIVLGLWMDLGTLQILESALNALTNVQTVSLILIVGFIMLMSRLMEDAGHMERVVNTFNSLSKDARIAGSAMPALIGLLPMPGGALFSAPMVDTALCRQELTGEKKTAVNYWFRHIWEYWWPLYPGVVLAVALLDVDTWRFMIVMAPMTLVTVLSGVIFILRPIGRGSGDGGGVLAWSKLKGFLWEVIPILIVIFVIILIAGITGILRLTGVCPKIPGGISILPGLMASIIWVCAVNRISRKKFLSALAGRAILPMLLLVVAIMVFKGVMMDSQAVTEVRNELIAYRIPSVLIILIMPFLSGLITGIAIGFVGTSFPLIIPMFQNSSLFDYLSWAGLAYTFGYMGMMLSPVHLCFLVTKDYFNAGLLRSYQHLILPALGVMLSAALLFIISRTVLGL
jgi:uncharacterized protein